MDCIIIAVAQRKQSRKQPSPKKSPARKRRVNSILGPPGLSVPAVEVDVGQKDVVCVPATPATKLRLTLGSRKTSTPSLRQYGPKPPE